MRKLSVPEARVVEALRNGSPMRYAELRELAGSSKVIRSLVDDLLVERLPMGLYAVYDPEAQASTSFESFAVVAARRPDAVICFESAAAFYGLTVANPSEIWAAFPYNSTPPRSGADLGLRPSRWNDRAMSVGVDLHVLSGVEVRITSPARTVVDMIRFEKSKGFQETAGEVLASYLKKHRMAEVTQIATELGCAGSITPRLAWAQAMGSHR